MPLGKWAFTLVNEFVVTQRIRTNVSQLSASALAVARFVFLRRIGASTVQIQAVSPSIAVNRVNARISPDRSSGEINASVSLKSEQLIVSGLAIENRLDEAAGYVIQNAVNPAPGWLSVGPQDQCAELWVPAPATDCSGAGPDGYQTASRFNKTGDSFFLTTLKGVYGQHTISTEVKSNTGLPQKCRLSGGGDSADIDVTTEWTRVSFTFIAYENCPIAIIRTDTAGDPLDVLFRRCTVVPGPVAGAWQGANWIGALGRMFSGNVRAPARTANRTLDFTSTVNQQEKAVQLASDVPLALAAFTIYGVVKRKLGVDGTYYPFVANVPGGDTGLMFAIKQSGASQQGQLRFGTLSWSAPGITSFRMMIEDGRWHAVAITYDGAEARAYIDGVLVGIKAQAGATATISRLTLGYNQGASFPGAIAYHSLYTSAHSREQVWDNMRAITMALAPRGVSIAEAPFVAYIGDSLTRSEPGYTVPMATLFNPSLQYHNFGADGQTIPYGPYLKDTIDAYYSDRHPSVLVVWFGANDLNTANATETEFVAALKSYCLSEKAVGWKVVVCTVLPHSAAQNAAMFEPRRVAANDLIRGDPSFYDALADVGADSVIGSVAAAGDLTYYSDGVHLTTAGYARITPTVQAAIVAALQN